MLVEIETADDDYRGDLAEWLKANVDEIYWPQIHEALEYGSYYEEDDEMHGTYLKITKVDLSVYG